MRLSGVNPLSLEILLSMKAELNRVHHFFSKAPTNSYVMNSILLCFRNRSILRCSMFHCRYFTNRLCSCLGLLDSYQKITLESKFEKSPL